MSAHVISNKLYVTIWIALMCLTVITAGVAFIDLGPLNTVVALSIATFKAILGRSDFHARKVHQRELTKPS